MKKLRKKSILTILGVSLVFIFYFLYFFPVESFSIVEERPKLFRYENSTPEGYLNGKILTIQHTYGSFLRSRKENLTLEIMEFSSAELATKFLNSSLKILSEIWEYQGETTLANTPAKIFYEKNSGRYIILLQKDKKIISAYSKEAEKAKKVIEWME